MKAGDLLPKEFIIEYIRRPNMPCLYGVKYDGIMLGEFASYPSAADCQTALERHRLPQPTDIESARVKKLKSGKYPYGRDEPPEAA